MISFEAYVFIQTALEILQLAKDVGWSKCSVMDILEQTSPERHHPGEKNNNETHDTKPQNHNKFFKFIRIYNRFCMHLSGYETINVIPLQVVSVYWGLTDKWQMIQAVKCVQAPSHDLICLYTFIWKWLGRLRGVTKGCP